MNRMQRRANKSKKVIHKEVLSYDINGSFIEFVEWMNDIFESIPDQYRDRADIEISTNSYDSDDYDMLLISYNRPKTDEELEQEQQEYKVDLERQRALLHRQMTQLQESIKKANENYQQVL